MVKEFLYSLYENQLISDPDFVSFMSCYPLDLSESHQLLLGMKTWIG